MFILRGESLVSSGSLYLKDKELNYIVSQGGLNMYWKKCKSSGVLSNLVSRTAERKVAKLESAVIALNPLQNRSIDTQIDR